ncbi:MAG: two-component regulator propeller domain-containing protein [Proteiniphilum sp.]|uniref:hybrid sensor histidine kinase/response regulator transcription factor n=1 Tax=Proteiniphilum sp. TaxID=1926877 RepID=UPI0009297B2D|nr:hybrid sensor histidine kinase/response regulator transcription factor [Proteiniphilum sp.]MEA5128862.1 two-component regulator propeller domain-containing protein [Proteiniphilum sp.]OJV88598.1 MAG: hypothetical protein BGO34_18470 [Bacteroidia bacterium 44-10]
MKNIFYILFLILPITVYAVDFDIKSLTNKDGLSNSSINVIFQDSNQLMWFGTWDGLNLYNSKEFQVFKPVPGDFQSISNNIIRDIIEEKKDFLWIATDIGINRLNIKERVFEHFFVDPQRREITNERSYLIAGNSEGKIVAYVYQQGLYYFDTEENNFISMDLNNKLNIKKILFDENDNLWVLTKEKSVYTITLETQGPHISAHNIHQFSLNDIENIFNFKSGQIILQTSDYQLYTYHNLQNKITPFPIQSEIGYINDIAFHEESTYIGTNKGLYRYNYYTGIIPVIENIPVLSVLYSITQNIIWVGTDMKGIYKIVPSNERFKIYSSENIPNFGTVAVRAFFEDENQTLWVGTKGAGIYNFRRDPKTGELQLNKNFSIKDGLLSNSVFKIVKGFINEYWIGTDGDGINYYDKKSNSIRSLNIPADLHLASIYAILPDSDNILWVGTSGQGMYKLKIDLTTNPYRVIDYKQFVFKEGESSLSNNIVYSIIKEEDTLLWIGTRGGGINKFDIMDETFEVLKFSKNNSSSDDVLCLHKDNKGNLWVGTSMGINKVIWNDKREPVIHNFSEKNGIPNNTIHGILEDKNNNLWITTNNGLTKLIPDEGDEHSYYIISYFANDGLQDNEFSDGAYYQSLYSPLFYFGGINGFNEFDPLKIIQNEYMPELWLDAFFVDNIDTELSDYLVRKKNREVLTLSHKNKSFSFRFIPMDYLASAKCEIAYLLEGFHNTWVNLGASNTIVFTNLPKGKYRLKVKVSNANKIWSDTLFSLPIEMTPPWWKSNLAFFSYIILLLCLAAITRRLILYRIKLNNDIKMKEIEKQKAEEVHQGKLRFFTNIAHEFSNSLTLIYGPCEKLMKEKEIDSYTKKYLGVIKSNSERMQHLIEQLVEFRKAETGHLKLNIEPVDIAELIKFVIDNFIEILEQKKIDYSISFLPDENITWTTDRNNLEKIIFNLLSNAVKYTPEKEKIQIDVRAENDLLLISIKNTGVGIKPEYFNSLFDRFEVLDRFEKQASIGNYPRHGIGLALSKSIANLLNGDIRIESDGDTFTLFEVYISQSELTSIPSEEMYQRQGLIIPQLSLSQSMEVDSIEEKEHSSEKVNFPDDGFILIVEDDDEIRSMIKELLSTDYSIVEASNGREALRIVNTQRPILVISDIIMPEMSGVEFVKIMKAQEFTSHIPIILLSSKNSIESQIEGFESGADAYINKPFNFRHLEVIVKNLLHKKNVLEEYSHSPYSTLEQYEGNIVHKEDKDLILRITKIIHDNMDNEELTIDFIANETAISKIQLYRKIKEITKKTPTEFIRSVRLKHAAKLLKTTNKTVQEVIYATGFNNKAYFYREFFKQYNKTPKEYREHTEIP